MGHDLSRYPYIGHHTDSRLEKMTVQWLLEHGLSPEPKLWIDDIFCCRSMAEAGVGWTIVPHICLNGFVGNVTPLFLKDGTPLERETTAIYRNAQADLGAALSEYGAMELRVARFILHKDVDEIAYLRQIGLLFCI